MRIFTGSYEGGGYSMGIIIAKQHLVRESRRGKTAVFSGTREGSQHVFLSVVIEWVAFSSGSQVWSILPRLLMIETSTIDL